MAFEGNCSQNLNGTGVGKICVTWSSIAGFWRAALGFEFASESDAQDLTKIQEAIQNEKLYPFPNIFSFEVEDEDTVNEEGSLGIIPIRKGKKAWNFMIATNPYQDACLFSQDNASGGIYYISTLGDIRGITDGTAFKPIPYQLFQVQKPVENNGADTGNKTAVRVVVADINAYIKDVAIVENGDITWNALSIEGLYPVQINVQSASATTIVAAVTIKSTSIPVTGLDSTPSADFIVKTAAGVEIVPSLISEADTTGVYTLTVAGLVTDDTIALQPPSLMTTNQQTTGIGYKGDTPVTMTVV